MSNRNRPKSKSNVKPFVEVGFSSNLVDDLDGFDDLEDGLDYPIFSYEELDALAHSLCNSIPAVESFLASDPPEEKRESAEAALHRWKYLLSKIEDFLDSVDD